MWIPIALPAVIIAFVEDIDDGTLCGTWYGVIPVSSILIIRFGLSTKFFATIIVVSSLKYALFFL